VPLGSYVVIEGLIGVGKSTLSRIVAEAWDARLVLEPNEHNPFLEPFYADPTRYAFPVQMYYLATRWKQQEEILQGSLFESATVVSDYLFEKDRLFAEKTLDELELDLYDRFANTLCGRAATPDLVVYLHAPIDVLMARIAERRAPGETAITPEYLEDLARRYERLWGRWTDSPLLRIDNRDMDYRSDPAARAELLSRIATALRAPGSIVDREAQPRLFGT
jgi:deoxyguanosine kinase